MCVYHLRELADPRTVIDTGRMKVYIPSPRCNLPGVNKWYWSLSAAQFMYHRDQHEDPSLLSYFDDQGTTATPVSPLATTAAVAAPQGRVQEDATQSTSGDYVEGRHSVHYCTCKHPRQLAVTSGPNVFLTVMLLALR